MSSKTDPSDGGKGVPPTEPRLKEDTNEDTANREGKKNPAAIRPAILTFSCLTEDLKGHINDVGTLF